MYKHLDLYESELLDGWISLSKDQLEIEVMDLRHVDHSLLTSLMQKSIRRGLVDWAVSAALALQASDPAYPWRRLRGIATEDVSLANPDLVAGVLALAGKQSLINKLGAPHLLAHTVARLAASIKYRGACDVLMLANAHPQIDAFRAQMMDLPRLEWVGLLSGSTLALWQRAALLQLIAGFSVRQGNRWLTLTTPNARVLGLVLDEAAPATAIEYIARKGTRNDGLAQLALLCVSPVLGARVVVRSETDPDPSLETINGVPAYAYCLFSGPGRAALRAFLRGNHALSAAALVRRGVRDPLRALGHLVFQQEGGQCDRLLDSDQITAIRGDCEDSTLAGFGVPAAALEELRSQFPLALGELNRVRRLVSGHLFAPDLFP
jgi:hypothetical protein